MWRRSRTWSGGAAEAVVEDRVVEIMSKVRDRRDCRAIQVLSSLLLSGSSI